MAALLGVDAEQVKDLCARASQQTSGILVLANDNCPGQSVISGDEATIEAGMALAKEAGAKKVVKLAVSIASHSPLMESAAVEFEKVLAATAFQPPQLPVYGNVEAAPMTGVEAIRRELSLQLTRSVRWTESVQAMVAAGATLFVELGSKDVLTGLLKRIDRTPSGRAVNSVETLRKFLDENG
jgi:[acyl-carrier-protein] S-malonyltransferase